MVVGDVERWGIGEPFVSELGTRCTFRAISAVCQG